MKKWIGFALSFVLVLCLGGCRKEAASIGIIGGADGPTAILISSNINWLAVCGLIALIIVLILLVRRLRRNKKK